MGATLRYLPKYSPDLNPIEMPYSKFKTFLRKVAARTIPSLNRAIPLLHPAKPVLKNVPTISGMQAMFQYDQIRFSSYQKAFTGGCFVLFRPEGDVSRAASPALRAPVTLAFGAA